MAITMGQALSAVGAAEDPETEAVAAQAATAVGPVLRVAIRQVGPAAAAVEVGVPSARWSTSRRPRCPS